MSREIAEAGLTRPWTLKLSLAIDGQSARLFRRLMRGFK